ncbi:FtsX-like permease family protein [Desulfocurvibacter africanus]|uniref:Cell division protein FtsX n=1 Tax=Desulfocurvibacter africanus subsp. africanus str. Walvis Bay TaxID=690850 RepID=F3YY99_DESAF|nr:FtsX-like permease family protein [Desulfocurvibacter africanus]EGJ49543.1 protein of unknown function DUF214 [Desulfocurvibacter africanus subsp. africanus str. Walvis Bay]
MRTFLRLVWRGVEEMALHPWAQLLTLAAVTLVAFLAGLFLLFLHNLEQRIAATQGHVEFHLYWRSDGNQNQVEAQWRELRQLEGLESMQTYTPKQALDHLATSLNAGGTGGRFGWMKDADKLLPATALLNFSVPTENTDWAKAMLDKLRKLPGLDSVHYNPLQYDMARTWSRLSNRMVWLLVSFLAVVAGLSVGNTIKLSLYSRRSELEILHLVGATESYIRMPLLVEGAMLGAVGSFLALGLLKLLQLTADSMLNVPPLLIQVQFLPQTTVLSLAAVLTGVCVLSSWVAVSR